MMTFLNKSCSGIRLAFFKNLFTVKINHYIHNYKRKEEIIGSLVPSPSPPSFPFYLPSHTTFEKRIKNKKHKRQREILLDHHISLYESL